MQNNDALEKLRRELRDVSDLLDGALVKAKKLENKVSGFEFGPSLEQTQENSNNTDMVNKNDPPKVVRPDNWDSIKDSTINESIKKIDEGLAQKEEDTRKARFVDPKKQNLKSDDWEDTPF